MTKNELNQATTFEAARFFLDLGLTLVPVPRTGKHKEPRDRGWQKRIYHLKEFVDEQNLGARLGEEVTKGAFLADVDIDMKLSDKLRAFPGAADVVAELLPQAGWVFGRDEAPRAHLMYLTTAPVTTTKYEGLNDSTLIELRGRSGKKQSSQITVIPPGVHESGQTIAFADFDVVLFASVKDAEGLALGVRYAAVALAILQVWPQRGKRHDARLAFAKLLLEVGLSKDWCAQVLVAVNRATGSDVADVASCLSDTLAKDPQDTKGASWIAEHLDDGAATLKVIDKLLGRKASLPVGSFDVSEIDLKTLTPQIWARLHDTNDPARRLLQGGQPVRVTHIPDHERQRRPKWVFQPLDEDRLRHETTQVASFFILSPKGYRQVAPPRDVIADMLATPPSAVPLPTVTRIIYAPIMASDGTIQTAQGYQPATGTFFVAGDLPVPDVAHSPSTADVARAASIIREPLQDFPFVSDANRTAAVAFWLLPFVRNLIDGPTPLHLFKKPVAGAGATLLTDTLLFPSVGTAIAHMSPVTDDDEWRKTITATLLDGPSVILIDNVRELLSPQLAKAVTDDIWQARILGVSRNAMLPVECVWGATGINPDIHTELSRRIVFCRLEPQVERPWLRDGFRIPSLRDWSRDHRGEMIWAALTMARAWHVAGRPAGDRSLGMFESWARVVGGVLKFAGFTDFLANLSDVYDDADVEGDALHWFYDEWNTQHQNTAVTIANTALWALAPDSPMLELISSASDKGRLTQYSTWVRRLKNRIVEVAGRPMRIEQVKASGKTRLHTWRLTNVVAPAPQASQEALPI